jgi:dTDP-glucose 4,6-dehydratase
MNSLLVTGGAGFIGANFARFWRQNNLDDRILVLDALTYAGNPANLHGLKDIDLVVGDICDTDLVTQLIDENQVNQIVHFAAESHVDRSIDGPDAFIETNVIGTHSLLKAAKTCWIDSQHKPQAHRFHHVSTDEVYGSLEPGQAAFNEETAYAPNSPYSASKAASDHLVRAYHHTFGLNVTTSNCSNNYGPYQFPEKLIPLFLINCLSGKPLPIYGDGMNVRDWLHVEDHCRGISKVIKNGKNGETYVIGGGEELPNMAVIDAICATVDKAFAENPDLAKRFPEAPAANGVSSDSLKTYVTDRPGHDKRYAIDERKARVELGYRPLFSFEEGFSDTLQWYLNNENWWRSILDGSYLADNETK